MTIELSPEQVDINISLLNRLADLYSTEAAALARMAHPVAQELAEDRLDAIGSAQELIAVLAE